MLAKIVVVMLLVTVAPAGWSGEAAPAADDPVLESRVQELSAELRCLVCQNESLAASRAPLAVDLRGQIRERMQKGESDQQIVDFLVSRYGDFVLYRPPLKPATLLLWLGPLLLLAAGFAVLVRRLKRRPEMPTDLSESERAQARALLSGDHREQC